MDPDEILGTEATWAVFDELTRLYDSPTEGRLKAMICETQKLKMSTDCNIFDEAMQVLLK